MHWTQCTLQTSLKETARHCWHSLQQWHLHHTLTLLHGNDKKRITTRISQQFIVIFTFTYLYYHSHRFMTIKNSSITQSHVTNEEVRHWLCQSPPVTSLITTRWLCSFGHTVQANQSQHHLAPSSGHWPSLSEPAMLTSWSRQIWLHTIKLHLWPVNVGLTLAWNHARDHSRWCQVMEMAVLSKGTPSNDDYAVTKCGFCQTCCCVFDMFDKRALLLLRPVMLSLKQHLVPRLS